MLRINCHNQGRQGGVDDTTDANEFEKPSDFDLSLNETLNIVKDYLKIKEPKSSALNEIEKSQEI